MSPDAVSPSKEMKKEQCCALSLEHPQRETIQIVPSGVEIDDGRADCLHEVRYRTVKSNMSYFNVNISIKAYDLLSRSVRALTRSAFVS